MAYTMSHERARLVLSDGRVALRAITPRDAAKLADGEPGPLEWLDDGPGPGSVEAAAMTVKAAVAGLYRSPWGLFAILRAEDRVAVGGIGFHGPPSDGAVEVGYDLTPSARGAGWATEALRVLVEWALEHPEVHTVTATTEPENAASQRVLARAGFHRVEDRGPLRTYERRAADDPAEG